MSIYFLCSSCNKKLRAQDKFAGKQIRCPRCDNKCPVPERQEVAEEVEDSPTEEGPLHEEGPSKKERRLRKKVKKQIAKRRLSLAWVSRGLGFHYAAMLFLMGGLAVFFLTLASEMVIMVVPVPGPTVVEVEGTESSRDKDFKVVEKVRGQSTKAMEAYAALNVACYVIAAGAFALALLLDVPSGLFCFQVPENKCRLLLLLALLLRALVIVTAFWFVAADHKRWPTLTAVFLIVGAWIVWMCYLRELAVHLDEDGISRETVRVLIMAFVNTAVTVLFLLVTFYFGLRMVFAQDLRHRFLLLASYLLLGGAFVFGGYKLSGEESLLKVILYPTGIMFLLQYLEIIGSLRLTLLRRS